MANMVFYDFETCSSNVSYGQIIQAAAVLVNDNFQELDRYEGRCRLSPGIIPEAMALIVNKTYPKILNRRSKNGGWIWLQLKVNKQMKIQGKRNSLELTLDASVGNSIAVKTCRRRTPL